MPKSVGSVWLSKLAVTVKETSHSTVVVPRRARPTIPLLMDSSKRRDAAATATTKFLTESSATLREVAMADLRARVSLSVGGADAFMLSATLTTEVANCKKQQKYEHKGS